MYLGTTFAARYLATEKGSASTRGLDRYEGVDQRLNKPVVIDVITAATPGPVLKAASLAKTFRDRRFASVLHVATDKVDGASVSYVVREPLDGTRLDSAVGDHRRLEVAAARSLVAALAQATIEAQKFGLFHGNFTLDSVAVSPRGKLHIAGVGTAAVLATQEGVRTRANEAADAAALGELFVRLVTAKTPSEVDPDELPAELTKKLQGLCASAIRGTGPRTLNAVTTAMGPTSDAAVARVLTSVVALPEAEVVDAAEVVEAGELGAADTADAQVAIDETLPAVEDVVEGTEDAPTSESEGLDQAPDAAPHVDKVSPAEPAAPVEAVDVVDAIDPKRLAKDDPLVAFEYIVEEQNVGHRTSVAERFTGWLHQRNPDNARFERWHQLTHERASKQGSIPTAPILLGAGAVAIVIAAMIAFNSLTTPPERTGPSRPNGVYPEFTFSPTPTVDPSAEVSSNTE